MTFNPDDFEIVDTGDQNRPTFNPEDFEVVKSPRLGAVPKTNQSSPAETSFATDVKDVGASFMKGAASIPNVAGQALSMAGADKAGEFLKDIGHDTEQYWDEKISESGRKTAAQGVLSDEEGRIFSDTPIKSLFMSAAQSTPGMFAMAPMGAPVAAGAKILGAGGKVALALQKSGVPGRLARRLGHLTPSALGFGSAEGVFSGLENAHQAGQEIEAMPEDKLLGSPKYQELVSANGGDIVAARVQLKEMVEEQTFLRTAPVTAVIGAATGGGILGKVSRKAEGGIIKSMFDGAKSESIQEFFQSGAEQVTGNTVTKGLVDPSQKLSEGVLEAAVSGAGAGLILGGAGGGVHGTTYQKPDPNKGAVSKAASKASVDSYEVPSFGGNYEKFQSTQEVLEPEAEPSYQPSVPEQSRETGLFNALADQSIDEQIQADERKFRNQPKLLPAGQGFELVDEKDSILSFMDTFAEQSIDEQVQADERMRRNQPKQLPPPERGFQLVDGEKKQDIPRDVKKRLRKEARKEAKEDPVYGHMAEARTRALNLGDLYQSYDKETVKEISRKYPAIFSLNGKVAPDEFAAEKGYESLDQMIETFKSASSRKSVTKKLYEAKVQEWHNAESNSVDAISKEEGQQKIQSALDIIGQAKTADDINRFRNELGVMAQQTPLFREHYKELRSAIQQKEAELQKSEQTTLQNEQSESGVIAEKQNVKVDKTTDISDDKQGVPFAKERVEEKTTEKQKEETAPRESGEAVAEDIDAKAHEAATSPQNDIPQPTEAQKEAGNYKKGSVRLNGFDISIENPKGSERSGTDPNGKKWSIKMDSHYGYLKGTVGKDKDHLDVFIGENTDSNKVYVVDQVSPGSSKFDEHKILMNFGSKAEARKGYLANYEKGWKGLGAITEMSVDEFKEWTRGDTTRPLSLTGNVQLKEIERRATRSSEIADRKAFRDNLLDEIKDSKKRAILEKRLSDRLLGEHGGTTFLDVDDAIAELEDEGIPFAYERADGGNIGGLNKYHNDVHDKADEQIREVWGDILVKEVLANGGIIGRDQGDEFKIIWPNMIAKEATAIRVGIEKNIRNKMTEMGLEELSHPKQDNLTTGALYTYYGIKDSTDFRRPDGSLAHGDLDRAADMDQSLMKDEELAVMAEAQGYIKREDGSYVRGTTERETGAQEDSGPKGEDGVYTENVEGSSYTGAVQETPEETGQAGETRQAGAEPIGDFGEKIGGARKDYFTTLTKAKEMDIASHPLSKTFPKPDYQKLVDSGADRYIVGFVRASREEIPNKPRSKYRLSRWVEQAELLRDVAGKMLSGKIPKEKILEKMPDTLRDTIGFRAELYADLGHSKSLQGLNITKGSYSVFNSVKHDPPKIIWSVERKAKATAFSNFPTVIASGDTRAEAIADFKEKYAKMPDSSKTGRKVKFSLYRLRNKKGAWIGKKVGRNYIDLKSFDDIKSARAYLDSNYDDLVAMLEKKKYVPDLRRKSNEERIGIDHRNGKDVTPEKFTETFGFRGVEFGNWVAKTNERQNALNNAYDALSDLAVILDIPTKAMSLNGELGLAFGARGRGGKGAAAAHYEPGRVVINLTRKEGAGSLAHEWWHALDNYFSRLRKYPDDHLTERPYQLGPDNQLREEMISAFKKLVDAYRSTGIPKRSRKLDSKRTKAYWSTDTEISARAFEGYVIGKLEAEGNLNDYLANIVGADFFAEDMIAHMAEPDFQAMDYYPYATEEEYEDIAVAFDDFFKAVKSKKTDKGIALFSRTSKKPWPKDFPNATTHTTLVKLREHPGYKAAKGDDIEAAIRLVSDLAKPGKARRLFKKYGDAIVVAPHAEEEAGRNAIPRVLGEFMQAAGFKVDTSIVQTNRAARTKKGSALRLAVRPEFDGDVIPGQKYLVVDDALGMGGTVSELRHYIENNGGEVVFISALTSGIFGNKISVLDETVTKLKNKYGQKELEDFLYEHNVAGSIEALTEKEGRYILKQSSLDSLRDRIITQARKAGISPSTWQVQASFSRLVSNTPSFEKWFGNSKIVDKNDNPKILYHGSPTMFRGQADKNWTFDEDKIATATSHGTSGLGFFFSPDKHSARSYAKGGETVAVYMRMENPYEMSLNEAQTLATPKQSAKRREELKDEGYDGVIIKVGDVNYDYHIVFDPNQVKSVDRNSGEYSQQDDHILRAQKKSSIPAGRKVSSVRREVDKITKGWKKQAIVVENVNKLPQGLRNYVIREGGVTDVQGLYDPQSGDVYLIAGNITKGDDLKTLILHEIVGHFGVESVLEKGGFSWAEIAEFISSTNRRSIRKARAAVRETHGKLDDRIQAKEVIAYLAQNNPKHSLIRRIIAAIREGLQKLGFDMEVTESDVLNLIRQAEKGVKSGVKNSQTAQDEAPTAQKKAPVWYSPAARAAADLKQKKGSPAQMLAMIKKQPGVKAEELEWIGLKEWLDGKKSVTRDEIAEFIEANGVQVADVVKGDFSQDDIDKRAEEIHTARVNERVEELEEQGLEISDDTRTDISNDIEFPYDEAAEELKGGIDQVKFADYQLPGGENYKELLLTLPVSGLEAKTDHRIVASEGAEGTYDVIDPDGYVVLSEALQEDAEDYISGLGHRLSRGTDPESSVYQSSHYDDEPNVLAHIRFNERTDTDGNRVLFIEELQSDWHQEGRKKGYNETRKDYRIEKMAIKDAPRDVLYDGNWEAHIEHLGEGRSLTKDSPIWIAYDSRGDTIASNIKGKAGLEKLVQEKINEQYGVPNAPFKKSWPALAMRRMIRYAAENGFDKIAWTTGEQQIDRYDLSKQIQSIEWTKGVGEGKYQLTVVKLDGENLFTDDVFTADEMVDTIGKEHADKVVNAVNNGQSAGEFSGLDLKVGGEGMKGFYDKILPSVARKLGKKYGGKVGVSEIGNNRDVSLNLLAALDRFRNGEEVWAGNNVATSEQQIRDNQGDLSRVEEGTTVHSLDLTDSMKQVAMSGMPLFSRKDKEHEEYYNSDMEEAAGFVKEHITDKADSSILERIFSTAEYIFHKAGAAKRMFEAQLKRRDQKFEYENIILDDFVQHMQDLKKTASSIYNRAKKYLLKVDRTGEAFSLSRKGDLWVVMDPKGKEVASYTIESEAVDGLMQAEADYMKERGYAAKVIDTVMRFRAMTNRAFDLMVADMRRVIDEAREQGLDEPTVSFVDEERRWEVYQVVKRKEKSLGEFSTEKQAKSMVYSLTKTDVKYSGLKVRRRDDSEIRKEVSLSEAIAMMGDLRGAYFPRIRQPGAMILTAEKDGDKILEKFDVYAANKQRIDPETGEVILEPKGIKWIKKYFNAGSPLGRRARALEKEGYTVNIRKDESVPESVFDAAQLMASIDALLNQSLTEAKKGTHGERDKAAREINKILTVNIADLFKARGYLASRLKRADDYWRGFEEDPLLAGTQYARNIASGFAKREAARNMTLAVTGRDISWSDWQKDNEDGTYEDYLEFVSKRRIDPGKQKNLHREAMSFMREVLRNEEQSDRIMGTLKGLAVLKFLGFRVSSAAVNMTNMVQAVPATISSHSTGTITQALNEVKRAAVKYGKYRSGKGELSDADRAIFLEISDRGWDEAQFNHDAAQVLRSKVGNKWDKFIGAGMYMFGAAEKANRATTIFAAYKQFKKHHPELGHEELMEKAKHASDRAHGIYGKETAPAWTRGSVNPLKLAYTFQKFSHNYLLNMGEMGMKGDRKQFAYMLFSPAIIAGPGASLATPILQAALRAFGVGGDDPEEEFYQWAEDFFGSDRISRHGLAGAMGVNLRGSLQIHNPMPRNLKEVLGAPGSVFTDVYDAAGHFRKGEFFKTGEKLLPTGFGSGLKAVREYGEGVTTGSYSPVYYGTQPLKGSAVDAALRFFSFNPSRLSGIRDKQWREKKVASRYAKRKKDIYSRIKHAMLSGGEITDKEWAKIDKLIQRYNEMVIGSGRYDIRPITRNDIVRVLRRSNRPSKRERSRGLRVGE